MIQNGLNKISPHKKDYSFLHTFGATTFDAKSLPPRFSIYDGRVIPNQNAEDHRFTPPLPPMPLGCTGETGSFARGLEEGKLYNPEFTYRNTPPGNDDGRDIREMLKALKRVGVKDDKGNVGDKSGDFFNVYGAGKIDDFDAARIALWINQTEKRGVIIGTWWYGEFEQPITDDLKGILPTPSFKTAEASLHCHLITGWDSTYKGEYLQDLSWQGMNYADAGIDYIPRATYNALLAQPWTGAFTIAKLPEGQQAVPLGMQVYIDHLVYLIRQLFNV